MTAARQVIGATNPLEAAPGLDPRRLRASRSARTWSTARTRDESAEREANLFFPSSAEPDVLASALAAAAGDPRAARRRASTCGRPTSRSSTRGRPARGRARERAPQGARGRRARPAVLGVDTLVALDGAIYGKPRRRRRRRARRSAALRRPRRTPGGRRRWRSPRRRRSRRRVERHRRSRFRALDEAPCSTGTSPPASGAGGPAATRSRAAARRSCAHRRATTSTSSACRSRALLELLAALCSARMQP